MDIINRLQIEASREPHDPIWWDAVMEIRKLRAFARGVMKCWPEGDVCCEDLQGFAVKCELLTSQTMFAPCGDNCGCADVLGEDEFAEGVTCYRKAGWLMGDDE